MEKEWTGWREMRTKLEAGERGARMERGVEGDENMDGDGVEEYESKVSVRVGEDERQGWIVRGVR